MRDLRDNRVHPEVHVDRLRRFHERHTLEQDEWVVDELLDVRRVKAAQARGPSRLEFLVKWRQFKKSESTWEPMEVLQENSAMADTIDEFLETHRSHPAVRQWRQSMTPAPDVSEAEPPPEGSGATPEPKADRMTAEGDTPLEAKYERGMWHYLMRATRAGGNVSNRWRPAHYFSAAELTSSAFADLRAQHMTSLPPERAVLVTTLMWCDDSF